MNMSLVTDKLASLVLAILVVYAFMLLPMDVLAEDTADGTPLAETLCNVVGWFTGTIGKSIATLAIIVIGVGALMGKVSWGMAIIVGIGVGVIFGAPQIVDALSDDNAAAC
jgi:type IV secretory pathway VirB2 component (pilin)